MQKELDKEEYIDLRVIFSKLWHKKWVYALALLVGFGLGCAYILPVPRVYSTSVSLAPESESSNATGGSLSSIASSFGIDLNNMQSSDAIYPLIYPDVISSTNFIVPLFNIRVQTSDGKINTDYYTYLTKDQKKDPRSYPQEWIMKIVSKIMPKGDKAASKTSSSSVVDPNHLTEEQSNVVGMIQGNVTCDIDRKTNIISISVEDQDPLVCATIADSVKSHLQEFIIKYRTSKAKKDVDYYTKLTNKAKADYENVRRKYVEFADANTDVTLQSIQSKMEDMENDMQLKYNTYTAFNTQLQAATANLQKRTPAFTTIQGASVPIKPSGPKRMLVIIGFMFLAFVIVTVIILRKDFSELIAPRKEKEMPADGGINASGKNDMENTEDVSTTEKADEKSDGAPDNDAN